jgi:hypothetical protein
MDGLERLHKKARRLAEGELAPDEEVVTVVVGRSKQAMVVTDRQLVIVKPGIMAGAWLGRKATSFPLAKITAINVHTGRGIAALELVVAGHRAQAKPDLTTAYQLPNWLPCHLTPGTSALVGHLRAHVQSDGRALSARAELSASE